MAKRYLAKKIAKRINKKSVIDHLKKHQATYIITLGGVGASYVAGRMGSRRKSRKRR